MNWGRSIALVMILFIAFIVTIVVIVMRQDDSLVEKDYYEKGIQYSTEMDRIARSKDVHTSLSSSELTVNLPVPGTIHHLRLMNMAHDNFDRELVISTSQLDSIQIVQLSDLQSGQWTVEVEGIMNADTFLHKSTQWIH
ncbi:MAG: FixH family protein [Flavobacteriales bacterium]|nr:FixH family protein [Bacteroidota bacterium]MCB9240449.1 FixH family protein [Flavobacteriales bacterium]